MIPRFALIGRGLFRRMRAADQKAIITEAREWAGVRLGIPNPSNVAERLDVLTKHKAAFWEDKQRGVKPARQRRASVSQLCNHHPRPVFSRQHRDFEGQARVNAVFDTFPPFLWRLTKCDCPPDEQRDFSMKEICDA